MRRVLRSCFACLGTVFLLVGLALLPQPALSDFIQQGSKLVGTTMPGEKCGQGIGVSVSADGTTAILSAYNNGFSETCAEGAWVFTRSNGVWTQQGEPLPPLGGLMGYSAALSADGNTAIIGGPFDNTDVGAAWVFTRSNGVWTQQGPKLVGTGWSGPSPQQGFSVALSADGNTALIGGNADGCNPCTGAAWVFTRSNGVWTQQGGKLVGTGSSVAQQGVSVALSGDGNTAMIGGWTDQDPVTGIVTGAAWVFTRSNGVWTQQGTKLIAPGGAADITQGRSVSLSSDGDTAIIGGPGFGASLGGAWVFTRSNGVWTQQSGKLVGTGAVGNAGQGQSVAISGDGNIAIVGGSTDASGLGAAWVFTRSNGVWTQQGSKVIGTGAVYAPNGRVNQGISIALATDGKTGIVGGYADDTGAGAAWVFVQNGGTASVATHDFDGDRKSDIVWSDTGGNLAVWLMNGAAVALSAGLGGVPTSWSIVGQRDFDGNGKADLLWRDTSGNTAIWFMNGTQVASSASLGTIPTNWSVAATGDFNGDGNGDILWRDNSGNVAVWLMNGATPMTLAGLGNVPTNWSVVATGDFNGDGMADILWRDTGGDVAIWFMNGTTVASTAFVGTIGNWSIVGTGDFDGDGKTDIVWRDTGGDAAIWLMNGAAILSAGGLGNVATTWSIAQVGDYNGDGNSDLLWRNNTGDTVMWFMSGTTVSSTASVGNIPTTWTVQSVNAE
jgi:FG-GAP-like repeat